MNQEITATISRTEDGRPEISISSWPDTTRIMTAAEVRSMAMALMRIASESVNLHRECQALTPITKGYALDSLSDAEWKVNPAPNGYEDILIEEYGHNGHRIRIYQNAVLKDGLPTFFFLVGTTTAGGDDYLSIGSTREAANQIAMKRKTGKYTG